MVPVSASAGLPAPEVVGKRPEAQSVHEGELREPEVGPCEHLLGLLGQIGAGLGL